MDASGFQHAVSRKIAQLAKVIFALNTKQEDHALQISYLTEAHEREIREVVQEANENLERVRDAVESARVSLTGREV